MPSEEHVRRATRSVAVGLLAVLLLASMLAPSTGAAAPQGPLSEQLETFRTEIRSAVRAYETAYANFTQAPNATARDEARQQMGAAGHAVGEAFLSFERGHGDEGSLSVFMQTQMDTGFYRGFEQDVVLLRATMLDASSGEPPEPSTIEAKASPVLKGLDRAEGCLPEGCGSAWTGAIAQSFFVLLREGFEAVLMVGAIVAYLHKSERSEKVRDVFAGVGAALVATLVAWFLLDRIFATAAARGSLAHAIVEAVTMLLASAVLFYVGFWLLSKVESERWRAFIDGKLEDSLADDRSWMLALIGFLAVFREGVETVLFVQAIAIGSGQAWGQILAGLGLGAAVLAGLYYAFRRTSVRIPLRTFFGVTSGILCVLSVRFLGMGIFELQEASIVSVTPLVGANAFLADHALADLALGTILGFSPTVEVALAQAILTSLVLAGAVWTFVVRPARQQPAAG